MPMHFTGKMDQPCHAPENAYNAAQIFKRNAQLIKERFDNENTV